MIGRCALFSSLPEYIPDKKKKIVYLLPTKSLFGCHHINMWHEWVLYRQLVASTKLSCGCQISEWWIKFVFLLCYNRFLMLDTMLKERSFKLICMVIRLQVSKYSFYFNLVQCSKLSVIHTLLIWMIYG